MKRWREYHAWNEKDNNCGEKKGFRKTHFGILIFVLGIFLAHALIHNIVSSSTTTKSKNKTQKAKEQVSKGNLEVPPKKP